MSIRELRLQHLVQLRDGPFNGSQAALAKAIGKSESQLSQWFKGFRTITEDSARSIERRLKLAPGALDVPIISDTSADSAPLPAPAPATLRQTLDAFAGRLAAAPPEVRAAVMQLVLKYSEDPAGQQNIAAAIEQLLAPSK